MRFLSLVCIVEKLTPGSAPSTTATSDDVHELDTTAVPGVRVQGQIKQYLHILREGTGPEVKEFFGDRDKFEQVSAAAMLPLPCSRPTVTPALPQPFAITSCKADQSHTVAVSFTPASPLTLLPA